MSSCHHRIYFYESIMHMSLICKGRSPLQSELRINITSSEGGTYCVWRLEVLTPQWKEEGDLFFARDAVDRLLQRNSSMNQTCRQHRNPPAFNFLWPLNSSCKWFFSSSSIAEADISLPSTRWNPFFSTMQIHPCIVLYQLSLSEKELPLFTFTRVARCWTGSKTLSIEGFFGSPHKIGILVGYSVN